MKRIIAILLAAVLALSLAACGGSGIDISQPEHLATFDEPSYLTEDSSMSSPQSTTPRSSSEAIKTC